MLALITSLFGNNAIEIELSNFIQKSQTNYRYEQVFLGFVVSIFIGLALMGTATIIWCIDNRKLLKTKEFWAPVGKIN